MGGNSASGDRASGSGLAARVATAAVAAPAAVALTVLGGWWFVALVLAVVGLAAWEMSGLLRRAGVPSSALLTLSASWAFPFAAALHEAAVGTALLGATISVGLLSLARSLSARGGDSGDADPAALRERPILLLTGWGLSIATGLYVGALLAPSIGLRERPDGLWWVAIVLGATWGCDTAAFFVGRRWGVHKLAPSVSPQKSVEGTLAGLAAAMLVAIAGGAQMAQPLIVFVGLGIVVAAGAVLGDLLESVLKRLLGAKDSGWMMPGHGGMLDRIDSLLLSSFLACGYIAVADGISGR